MKKIRKIRILDLCSTLGDRAFVVAGPLAWNTLPDAIRRCSSPDNFKR